MNRNVEIIAIDHGWSHIKTRSTVFVSGVEENVSPTFFDNVLEYNGKFYNIGGKRIEVKNTKVDNNDFYLLTLAAIAKELKNRNLTDANVYLAVGLPLTRFGEEKQAFIDYLKKDKEVTFKYAEKEYHITIEKVSVLSVSKTWDYKGKGGFQPTKNKSSVRKIQIDWQMVIQFSELIKGLPEDEPIFVKKKVYNSTVNDILSRYCKEAKIPEISVHGLRHTHASILLFAGVSIASVARRLGHASMTTTQKTYLHIIQELENRDVDLVMRSLSGLC